ncbi:PaaI family thioesterase [Sphingomonas sp. CL5.1]|uniref:PaaI family thioesterase n=1 Tax=Sphingomonas sp. CL5.1 TaxID=2653203 RepID=UPI0015996944|nr:PaaI family thioesterase [Sphingomonas sp. CL5.1]QKR98233.1 PaaI family thioesterase [Sphingomonas sp. CL5.1]
MNFDPAKMALEMIENREFNGHAGRLGVRFHAMGENWLELALPYSEELIGNEESGVIASGPIIAMMDVATSIAVWQRIGGFAPHATLDLRIDYLRPARPGRTVIGRAECLRVARSISFTRGIAHDGDIDDPIAHVAATFMVPSGTYPRIGK